MTLSNGLQFWVSVFVSGFIVGLLIFFEKSLSSLLVGGYTSYPPFQDSYPQPYFSSTNWREILLLLFGSMILVLLCVLIFKKIQLQRAHIWVNTVLFSSFLGILVMLEYISQKVEIKLRAENSDYGAMPLDEKIRLYTFIMLAVIGIYLLLAWLFKRHLTFPKKK